MPFLLRVFTKEGEPYTASEFFLSKSAARRRIERLLLDRAVTIEERDGSCIQVIPWERIVLMDVLSVKDGGDG